MARPCGFSAASIAGPADPALDPRRAARRVDLEHPVQAPHIEAHRPGIGVADRRLDAADDRGAAAERNDGDLRAARPVEHGGDLGFVRRQGDEVGRVGEVAREGADRLGIGLAVGVQEPLVRVVRQDVCERRRRDDARRRAERCRRLAAAAQGVARRRDSRRRNGTDARARRRSGRCSRNPSRRI